MICKDMRMKGRLTEFILRENEQPWFGSVQVYTAKLTFAIWVVLWRWLDCITTRLVPEPGRVALFPPLKPCYRSLCCTSAAPPPPPSHQISLFKGTTKIHAHKPQQRDFMGHYNGSSESGESADASLLPQEIKNKKREKYRSFANLCAVRQTVFLQRFVATKDNDGCCSFFFSFSLSPSGVVAKKHTEMICIFNLVECFSCPP